MNMHAKGKPDGRKRSLPGAGLDQGHAAADRHSPIDPDDIVHQQLSAHAPASPRPRAAFQAELRSHFVVRSAAATQRTTPPTRSIHERWRRALTWRGLLASAGFVTAGVAIALWLLPGAIGTSRPPAISLAELSSRNQRAWSVVHSVAGVFESDDGRYSEEWVSWAAGGPLRYKRYTQTSFVDSSAGQWNISDGQTAWRIDARTGEAVRLDRPPTGEPGGVGQNGPQLDCGALVLPAEVTASGATPRPAIHDGRAVYIVSPLHGPRAGDVFWVDANDSLVYRIDGADGRRKWFRRRLDINPSLSNDIFRPDSLSRL